MTIRATTNGAIAIMVKTPGRSPVKSRLAADCGALYAASWHRRAALAVAAVARAACEASGATAYWAVAEAHAQDAWPGLPSIAQGEGGLGERMARVHAHLVASHGRGLLLGADTPQLTVALIEPALQWLDAPVPRLALGPAQDGGFWLFGGNTAPPQDAWAAVRYSTPDTAREFVASMDGCGQWRTLATLLDVDHGADLGAVLAALRALEQPLPEQRALADWMGHHAGMRP